MTGGGKEEMVQFSLLKCLTSALINGSKMENTWAGNKFMAKTPSLPQAAGEDPFPCVWGKYSDLWERGACRAHCLTKAEGNKKVPCEDRMLSPSEERAQRALRQRM